MKLSSNILTNFNSVIEKSPDMYIRLLYWKISLELKCIKVAGTFQSVFHISKNFLQIMNTFLMLVFIHLSFSLQAKVRILLR